MTPHGKLEEVLYNFYEGGAGKARSCGVLPSRTWKLLTVWPLKDGLNSVF